MQLNIIWDNSPTSQEALFLNNLSANLLRFDSFLPTLLKEPRF